jgi:hypothetical protein
LHIVNVNVKNDAVTAKSPAEAQVRQAMTTARKQVNCAWLSTRNPPMDVHGAFLFLFFCCGSTETTYRFNNFSETPAFSAFAFETHGTSHIIIIIIIMKMTHLHVHHHLVSHFHCSSLK